MDEVIGKLRTVKTFLLIFVAVLLLSFHFYFTYFINSTYITGYVGEKNIGYVYALIGLVNIIVFLLAPKLLRRFGNVRLTTSFTLLAAACLIVLAFNTSFAVVISTFIIYEAIAPLLFYTLDIFLEKFSSIAEMGSIRGIYLTMMNLPTMITPFIVGLILTKPDYWKVYLIGAAFLVPFLIIILANFRSFNDPEYPRIDVKDLARTFYQNHNVFDVFLDNFLLNLFFAWMVIYMPIYLRYHIGFEWSAIGLMFSIMLLPFILFQIPVGRYEDEKHDEKSLLILGFTIISCATMLIPFIVGQNFVIWTAVLFITRVGASIVEVSSESYFFKHIHTDNAGFISLFRMTRALPYVIIPLVGVLLSFIDFKYIFLVLGIIMTLGVRYAFKLEA